MNSVDLDSKLAENGATKSGCRFGALYQHWFDVVAPIRSFVELGVQAGGSIKTWAELFPQAIIHGLDINPEECTLCRQTDQIRLIRCDQTDRKKLEYCVQQCRQPFDVVLDDAGHTMKGQLWTLAAFFPYVRSYGIYIIEDLHTGNSSRFGAVPDGSNSPFHALSQYQLHGVFEAEQLSAEENAMITAGIRSVTILANASMHTPEFPVVTTAIIEKK